MKHALSFRSLALALSLGASALLGGADSATAARPAPQLSAQERADVQRVERYLNEIRTLRSQFLQAGGDGSLVKGTFYMSRPGRMRLEYDPPIENFVVADGRFVFFWDAELKQQSNAPLGSTLADLILRDNLKLSGSVTVTDVERGANALEVTLIETDEPGKGQLTLVFEDNPLRLRKWRVLDAQGLTTEVALLNPEFGVPLDRDLFYFRDPTRSQNR